MKKSNFSRSAWKASLPQNQSVKAISVDDLIHLSVPQSLLSCNRREPSAGPISGTGNVGRLPGDPGFGRGDTQALLVKMELIARCD